MKLFSEHGHVAYQINGNDACSNMVANIFPIYTPKILRVGSKGQNSTFFQNMVTLHIKLKGMSI